MEISFRKIGLYTFYIYIASLFTLAYDPVLNNLTKVLLLAVIGFLFIHFCIEPYIDGWDIYKFLGMLAVYVTASAFWSLNFETANSYNFTIYQTIFLAFLVYNLIRTKDEIENLFLAIFWGCIIMCIYTIIKYGISEIVFRLQNGIRIGKEINQENAFGYYCVIAFIIGIYNLIFRNKKWTLPFLPLLGLLSFSSGSKRSIIVIVLALAVIFTIKSNNFNPIKFLLILAGCVLLFVILYNIEFFKPFFNRFLNFLDLFNQDAGAKTDLSTTTRLKMITFGLESFQDKVLFGHGTHNYNFLYLKRFGSFSPSHNNYVQLLVDYGLVGFSIYYSIYYYIVKNTYIGVKHNDCPAPMVFTICLMELFSQMTTLCITNKFSYIYLAIGFAYVNLIKKENFYNAESSVKYETFNYSSRL